MCSKSFSLQYELRIRRTQYTHMHTIFNIFKPTFRCFIPMTKSSIFLVPSTLISIASRNFSLNLTDATTLNTICVLQKKIKSIAIRVINNSAQSRREWQNKQTIHTSTSFQMTVLFSSLIFKSYASKFASIAFTLANCSGDSFRSLSKTCIGTFW